MASANKDVVMIRCYRESTQLLTCKYVVYDDGKKKEIKTIVVDQCKISKISSEIKLSDIKTFGLYHDPSLNEYTAYLVYGDTEIGTIQSRNEERLKELLQVIQQQNRQAINLSDIKASDYHQCSGEYIACLVYEENGYAKIRSRNEEKIKKLLEVVHKQNSQYGKWFIARSNIAEIQDKRHSTLQITQRAIAVIAISEDGNDIFARTWPVTKSSMLTVKSNDSVLMIGPQDSIPVRIEICSVGKRNSQEMVDAFEAFVLPEDGSYKSPNGETEIDPMAERPSSLYYHNAQVVSIVTTTREKAKPVLPTDVTEDNFIDYDDDDDYVDIRACEIPPQTHYVNQTAAPQGPPPPRPPKLHRCTIKRPQRTKKEEDDYVISHVTLESHPDYNSDKLLFFIYLVLERGRQGKVINFLELGGFPRYKIALKLNSKYAEQKSWVDLAERIIKGLKQDQVNALEACVVNTNAGNGQSRRQMLIGEIILKYWEYCQDKYPDQLNLQCNRENLIQAMLDIDRVDLAEECREFEHRGRAMGGYEDHQFYASVQDRHA